MTKLEYDFFTKIDKGITNDIELHYDGFIIASGITDETEIKLYREKLNEIRNLAKIELTQYINEGAYEFGKRLLSWIYEKGILKKYFENKVYKTVIPRNVRLSEAPSYGMPISLYDARSKGAKAYDKLTKEFLKNNTQTK